MGKREDRAWSAAGTGAASGASIGTAIYPGIGTAVGALVGGAAGFIVGNQPVPESHWNYDEMEKFTSLSSGAQYSTNEELTQSIKLSNNEFINVDDNVKTKDFEMIMGIGSSLANIYNSNAQSGLLESQDNILDPSIIG